MPILANAKKALRVSHRRAAMNQPIRSRMKTMLDNVRKLRTPAALATAFSAVDRAAKKNIIHRKKAAHLKSQMSRLVTTTAAPAKKATTAKRAKSK